MTDDLMDQEAPLVVAVGRIVGANPARDEYRPLIASVTARTQVGVARPEGLEHAPPTIVIRGVEELVEALLAA